MRGVRSLMAFLVAMLAVCLISVPAFSGEHPWDSDGSQSGSSGGSGLPADSVKVTTVVLSSSVGTGDGGQTVLMSSPTGTMSLEFRVSYYVAERIFLMQYEAGARVDSKARRTGR